MVEKEYIEREKLRQAFLTDLQSLFSWDVDLFKLLMIEIDEAPSADVSPVRHGQWVLLRESEITGFNPEFAGRDPIGGYQCSNCKKEAVLDCNGEFVLSSYCPNCGAKLDGEER